MKQDQKKSEREKNRLQFYRTFLLTLCVLGFAGAGTLWVFGGWLLAMAYIAGWATPILFAWYAPSWEPDAEEQDEEESRGFA